MEIFETANTFHFPDPRVWVAGDWHGNAGWVGTLLPAMRRHDPSIRTILQLGDYGFDHSQHGTHIVDYWAKKAGLDRALVVLGNHENWRQIVIAQEDVAPGKAIRVSEVVWLLPRPFRFRLGGRDVLSLGGASSVDKAWRTPGKDWFESELITEQMELDAIAGGRADVLLTHEAPVNGTTEAANLLAANPRSFPAEALTVSAAQRERVERVREAARPQIHLHGHMHVHGERVREDGSRVVSLDRDTMAGHAGVLDLTTLDFEVLPMSTIRRR